MIDKYFKGRGMQYKSRKVKSEFKTTVIDEDGIVRESSTERVSRIPCEPAFIKLYIEDIEKINNVKTTGLLYSLLKRMNYDGLIILNSTIKRIIAEECGYKLQTVNNGICSLVKLDLLMKSGMGCYIPNPNVFGRGSWAEILKRREAWIKVVYDKEGNRNFHSSFDSEDEDQESNEIE